mgnify:FL=1
MSCADSGVFKICPYRGLLVFVTVLSLVLGARKKTARDGDDVPRDDERGGAGATTRTFFLLFSPFEATRANLPMMN